MGRPRRSDETGVTLRHEIEHGRFLGARVLPGERQLASQLEVSRTTLRRALAGLIAEGILSQRQGLGTIINDAKRLPKQPKPINGPPVYYDRDSVVGEVRDLWRDASEPTPDEVMAFGLGPRQQVFRLSRILLRDGRPDAVERWCAPLRFLPDQELIGSSLVDALAAAGYRPAEVLKRVRASKVREADAEHLGTAPDIPAILVEEAFFLADGRRCLINRTTYPASAFDAVFREACFDSPAPDP